MDLQRVLAFIGTVLFRQMDIKNGVDWVYDNIRNAEGGDCVKRSDICVMWVQSVMLRISKILMRNNICCDIINLE